MDNRADLLQAGRAQLAAFRERVNTAKTTVFVKLDIGSPQGYSSAAPQWALASAPVLHFG